MYYTSGMASEEDWEGVWEFLQPKPPLYCPHDPFVKQKIFLRYEGLEALYGGRAGGGKSDALLMAALQYVDIPGYSAMIFRNSYADLALPGAIMDRSHEWLDEVEDARWISGRSTWQFPSGATLTFGYLDKPQDHLRYKGAEFQFIGFDEVTEIREKHYQYLFSRLRGPSGKGGLALANVPLRVRAASNPAPNWVRRRFIENPIDEETKEVRLYIPAGLEDNPFVGENYRASLAKLDPIERARLEKGDWWAEEEGALFSKESFKIIRKEQVPESAYKDMVRYWDLASTEPSPGNPDPDWTAGALVSIVDGYLIIHDMAHFRKNPAGVEQGIQHVAYEDGPNIKIRMEKEGGASGKITIDHYSRHVLLGFDFDGWPAKRDKVTRATLWAGKVKRGEVLLVQPEDPSRNWIKSFLDEAVTFGAAEYVHDDQIDAVSGAFEFLTGLGGPPTHRVQIIV